MTGPSPQEANLVLQALNVAQQYVSGTPTPSNLKQHVLRVTQKTQQALNAQKGAPMSTKTKAVDADVSEFYFRIDLAINPPLPDSKAKAGQNDYFTLKQKKDEDVQIVNGEIVVVSNNVTSIEQANTPEDYTYGYDAFKKAIVAVGKLAKDAGSSLDGQVVVKDGRNGRFFRLKVDAGTVTVESANLGWPDGTQTPFPDGGGA